jgi:hypothetical protein
VIDTSPGPQSYLPAHGYIYRQCRAGPTAFWCVAPAGVTALLLMDGEVLGSVSGGLACGACTVGSGFGWKGWGGIVVSDLKTADSGTGAGRRAVVDEAWVVRRAGELLAEGDPRYAREIVRDALDTFGRQADLLWTLADAEFANGNLIAGREYLDEALTAGPRSGLGSPADTYSAWRRILE